MEEEEEVLLMNMNGSWSSAGARRLYSMVTDYREE